MQFRPLVFWSFVGYPFRETFSVRPSASASVIQAGVGEHVLLEREDQSMELKIHVPTIGLNGSTRENDLRISGEPYVPWSNWHELG